MTINLRHQLYLRHHPLQRFHQYRAVVISIWCLPTVQCLSCTTIYQAKWRLVLARLVLPIIECFQEAYIFLTLIIQLVVVCRASVKGIVRSLCTQAYAQRRRFWMLLRIPVLIPQARASEFIYTSAVVMVYIIEQALL